MSWVEGFLFAQESIADFPKDRFATNPCVALTKEQMEVHEPHAYILNTPLNKILFIHSLLQVFLPDDLVGQVQI